MDLVDCGCRVETHDEVDPADSLLTVKCSTIVYCPTHQAAPELVEALKAWQGWYDGPYQEGVDYVLPPITKMKAALRKAGVQD